jgi:hypothetical protein
LLLRESSPLFSGMVAVLKQHNAVGPPQSITFERSHQDTLDATPNPKTLH